MAGDGQIADLIARHVRVIDEARPITEVPVNGREAESEHDVRCEEKLAYHGYGKPKSRRRLERRLRKRIECSTSPGSNDRAVRRGIEIEPHGIPPFRAGYAVGYLFVSAIFVEPGARFSIGARSEIFYNRF